MAAQLEVKFSVPERFRRGSLRTDERASVDSAHELLGIVGGIVPVGGRKILDFGCGVKLVQALLEQDYGHVRYAGVDVYAEMIDYLRSHVNDPRFEFGTLNFHNAMYNKKGMPMTAESRLPIADDLFDIITMFSVITHMVPEDALATFRILRGYAAPGAKLIFSTFIDAAQTEDFIDKVPDRPLLNAFYRKEFLDGLIERGGWLIASFNKPVGSVIQHYYVCAPA